MEYHIAVLSSPSISLTLTIRAAIKAIDLPIIIKKNHSHGENGIVFSIAP